MRLVAVGFQVGGNGALGQGQAGLGLVQHHDAGFDQLVIGEGFRLVPRFGLLPRTAALTAVEAGHHAFDIEHGIGQLDQFVRLHRCVGAPGRDHGQLPLQGIARGVKADHDQGLGQLAQQGVEIVEGLGRRRAALDQVDHVLDAVEFLEDGRGQRTHHRLPGAGEALVFLFEELVGEGQRGHAEDFADGAGTRPPAVGKRHQVEQLLQQAARRFVGLVGQQQLQFAIQAGEHLLARLACQQLAVQLRLDGCGADPAEAATGLIAIQSLQAAQGTLHQAQCAGHLVAAQEAEQPLLVDLAEAPGQGLRVYAFLQLRDHHVLARLVQAHAEEEAFRQGRLAAGLAQVVDRRQQQFGHFLAVQAEVFQVTAQHVQRIAQGRQLHVALFPGAGGNVGGLVQQFLGQQLGPGQLDQVEGAAHLVHGFHGLLQQAAVLPFGDEMLEALLGLFHGGEQLVAHQAQ
ncbi:hypothetical protein D9M70_419700 [compost metagenome]